MSSNLDNKTGLFKREKLRVLFFNQT
uniref:Uncharacterized protein n=1 Tax=Arundo donax TaxID=35708 RepID=A0A0A9A227_ARUDO